MDRATSHRAVCGTGAAAGSARLAAGRRDARPRRRRVDAEGRARPLGAWERRFVDLLERLRRGEWPDDAFETDELNARYLPGRAGHLARGRAARGGGGLEPVPRGGRGHDRRRALRRAPLWMDAGRSAGRLGHRQRQRARRRAPRAADEAARRLAGPAEPGQRSQQGGSISSSDAVRTKPADAARGPPRRGVAAACGPAATSPGGSTMDDQLLAAAASGDVAAITAALDGGANVDARDATGARRSSWRPRPAMSTPSGTCSRPERGRRPPGRPARQPVPLRRRGGPARHPAPRQRGRRRSDDHEPLRWHGAHPGQRARPRRGRPLPAHGTDVDVDHVNRLGWTALLEAIVLGDGGQAHQQVVDLLSRTARTWTWRTRMASDR